MRSWIVGDDRKSAIQVAAMGFFQSWWSNTSWNS